MVVVTAGALENVALVAECDLVAEAVVREDLEANPRNLRNPRKMKHRWSQVGMFAVSGDRFVSGTQ